MYSVDVSAFISPPTESISIAISRADLLRVAGELRDELISVGSRVGGHFAGSLGTVELSVGLHWVFETPHDRVVWDVGHQAYGHKALTGRRASPR